MIFLTVGTQYFGFERLVKEMDEISGKIDEEVVAQIGSTKYKPKNMKYFTFIEEEEKILELYKKARIIISHAGAGTILTVLWYKKPAIIVPRLKEFNEHIDNHQLELAEVLKKEGKAIIVYNIENLNDAINKTREIMFKQSHKNQTLVDFLKESIARMEK